MHGTDAPPVLRHAGGLGLSDPDLSWLVSQWTLLIAAVLIIGLFARGQWRAGLVVALLVGAGLELSYQWQAWTWPRGGAISRDDAIALTNEGVSQRLNNWAGTVFVAGLLGFGVRQTAKGILRIRAGRRGQRQAKL